MQEINDIDLELARTQGAKTNIIDLAVRLRREALGNFVKRYERPWWWLWYPAESAVNAAKAQLRAMDYVEQCIKNCATMLNNIKRIEREE